MLDAIDGEVFPCAAIFVSKNYKTILKGVYGVSNIFTNEKLTSESIFDLASLTKPLATTLAVAKLVEDKKLKTDENISNILTIFKNSEITIKELLKHKSGLPAHRDYYKDIMNFHSNKKDMELLKKIVLEKLKKKETLYSDIGFMILRQIVEKVSSIKFKNFVLSLYEKIEASTLHFPEITNKMENAKYVATEKCNFRGTVLEGVVHDQNAYAVNGVDGQSGLFGSIEDTHKLILELLKSFYGKSEKILKQKTIKTFFKRDKNDRCLGFDVPNSKGSSCGNYFSYNSVGHLGFTGTSFWMDLEKKIIIILLTNRIHPSVLNVKIKKFRPDFHNFVMENYLL